MDNFFIKDGTEVPVQRTINTVIQILLGRIARTTYVDAVYCYQPSSVVCRSVCLSCKRAEPIEMPFGLRTRVGSGNCVLDGGPDRPMRSGNF